MKIPKEIKKQIEKEHQFKIDVNANSANNDAMVTGYLGSILSCFFIVWSLPIPWVMGPEIHNYFSTTFFYSALASAIFFLLLSIKSTKDLWGFGFITLITLPIVYLIFKINKVKFIKKEYLALVKDKCIDIVPESERMAVDCLIQKNKLSALNDNLTSSIRQTEINIGNLQNMKTPFLEDHPMTKAILEKLRSQNKNLLHLSQKTLESIGGIDKQLRSMESQVAAISDYKTIVDSALLTESNDFIINEAKLIFEKYHNEIESRKSSILELESDFKVLGKSAHEIPDVVMALGGGR